MDRLARLDVVLLQERMKDGKRRRKVKKRKRRKKRTHDSGLSVPAGGDIHLAVTARIGAC